jgi:hypothetical protein
VNTALEAYFKCQLEALGYPTDDIRFSLGYCQGDGMAFYGTVSKAGIERLFARLMPPPSCELADNATLSERIIGEHRARISARHYAERKRALLPRLQVNLARRDSFYDHANTIGVSVTLEEQEDVSFSEVNLDPSEGSPRALCSEFERLLREDVREISHRLCKAGYSLIESTPYEPVELRSISTGTLRVRVLAVKDEDICLSGDAEYDSADLAALAEGRHCHCGIQVELIDLDDENCVDTETLWGVTLEGKGPNWSAAHVRAIARDLLREMRGRVSQRLKRLALAAGVDLEEA